jgi:NADH-quinone oxidoreductase subunit C
MTNPTNPSNPPSEPPEPDRKDQPAASGGVPTVPTGGSDSAPPGSTTAAGSYSSEDTPAEKPSGTTDDASAQGGESTAVAERALHDPTVPVPPTGVQRTGMFGVRGSGDTSGYGGLVRQPHTPVPAERPYGGYFDEVADALHAAMAERSIPSSAILQTTVAHNEITFYLGRDHLTALLWALRDDPSLRFELLSSLSGVDYGPGVPRRLHVVYELTSMTYRRRIRLEVAVGVEDPYVPSAVAVYPTADWHERETWDMFGIVFSGHPALTRILMPDDWLGHPQRKDYPLGGIPVEYKGAEIPPPDQRRAYS